MSKQYPTTSSVSQFLSKAQQLPARQSDAVTHRGRLLFAMDATASRQAHWDRACHLQSTMFNATAAIGGLRVQLCYYRGFQEFHSSPWFPDSQQLLRAMNRVSCLGGHTQLERVLKHCLKEHNQQPVQAAIIVADAMEEHADTLCNLAGQCGMLNLPLLMVQDGGDRDVETIFRQMAKLSGGAYCQLNEHSADSLAEFLAAAATFACGGQSALKRLNSPAAKQLLSQLRAPEK